MAKSKRSFSPENLPEKQEGYHGGCRVARSTEPQSHFMLKNRFVYVASMLAIAACGCSPSRIDASKFENVNRAAKAISAGLDTNTEFSDYANRVKELATEISVLRDSNLSEEETVVLQLYESCYDKYKDGITLWEFRDQQRKKLLLPAGEGFLLYKKGYAVYTESGLVQGIDCSHIPNLIAKHQLTVVPYVGERLTADGGTAPPKIVAGGFLYSPSEVITQLTLKANEDVSEANRILRSP